MRRRCRFGVALHFTPKAYPEGSPSPRLLALAKNPWPVFLSVFLHLALEIEKRRRSQSPCPAGQFSWIDRDPKIAHGLHAAPRCPPKARPAESIRGSPIRPRRHTPTARNPLGRVSMAHAGLNSAGSMHLIAAYSTIITARPLIGSVRWFPVSTSARNRASSP